MRAHLALLVLLLGTLTGCASKVTAVLSSDGRSGLSGGEGRRLVVVAPFDDYRPVKGVCGEQSGNFGSGPPVLCDREPAPFIASALIDELKRVGFEVETADRPRNPSDAPILRGELVQLYAQPTGGFSHFVMEADFHVRLEVHAQSGLVARRSFFVKGNRGVGGTVGGAAQESISDATNRIVKNMTAGVLSLVNQYPELGTARAVER
jgi:hypothetical protein